MNFRIIQFYYALGEMKGLYEGLTNEERAEVFENIHADVTFYRAMKETINSMRVKAAQTPICHHVVEEAEAS